MNSHLVGSVEDFGIEYSTLTSVRIPYGCCRIWIGNQFFGDVGDDVYLSIVSSSLEGISKYKDDFFLEEQASSLSDQELFDLVFTQHRRELEKYKILYVGGFDDFYNLVYRRGDCFHFVWKLRSNLQETDRYKDYPLQICSKKVDIATYEAVVEEFNRQLGFG